MNTENGNKGLCPFNTLRERETEERERRCERGRDGMQTREKRGKEENHGG